MCLCNKQHINKQQDFFLKKSMHCGNVSWSSKKAQSWKISSALEVYNEIQKWTP